MSTNSQYIKLFPLRLPPNFHGPIKLKNKVKIFRPVRDQQKQSTKTQPSQQINVNIPLLKKKLALSAWQKRRSDHQVNSINKFYIQHPSRSSGDNPEEFRNTLSFYRRSCHKYPSRDRSKYTIFGDEKPHKDYSSMRFNLSSCKFSDSKPISLTWTTPNLLNSSKISIKHNYSTISHCDNSYLKPKQYRIADKIGSHQRKLDTKSPTIIKIGHSSIIDSYSAK